MYIHIIIENCLFFSYGTWTWECVQLHVCVVFDSVDLLISLTAYRANVWLYYMHCVCLSVAKSLKDDATLESLGVDDGGVLYFKDLGPQIGWKTVGLHECYNIPQ